MSLELDKRTEKAMFYLRRKRYELFKETHNLSLMDITEEEWVYLQRKADLYEKIFGVDRFQEIFECYNLAMHNEKLLESSRAYNYFLVKINFLMQSDCKKHLRMVNFADSERLEELLGEADAIYNGENALLNAYYQKEVAPTILKAIGEERFEFFNDYVNGDKTLNDMAIEIGLTHQGAHQRVASTLRKIRQKTKVRAALQEAYECALETEETSINTNFVCEKQ